MKRLLFALGQNYYPMAEEGGTDGTGGGGGGAGGGSDDTGETQGDNDSEAESEDAGAGGALAKAGKDGDGDGADSIDWEKITDSDYFGKVTLPELEGIKINSDHVQKTYGEFCRKHHIDPKVVSEFLALEGKAYLGELNERKTAVEAENKALRDNFEAQGKDLRAEFNQLQIDDAIKTLQNDTTLNGDADFMKVVTGSLSNNKTIMRLILNWADTHKSDSNTGAGAGAGGGGAAGFAERWTGKKF